MGRNNKKIFQPARISMTSCLVHSASSGFLLLAALAINSSWLCDLLLCPDSILLLENIRIETAPSLRPEKASDLPTTQLYGVHQKDECCATDIK